MAGESFSLLPRGGALVVRIRVGVIRENVATEIVEAVEGRLARGGLVLVNLTHVLNLLSSAVGAFVRLAHDYRVVLVSARPETKRALEVLGLGKAFPLFEDEESALVQPSAEGSGGNGSQSGPSSD
ncbi:MAG: STAS domain-containing protein [Planctomycetales bacterium]|nr:STAS domain-containing protein [Planctomycetales bacterium]